MEQSALTDDWKKNTIDAIKAEHERMGLPYYTNGPERDKRAKEAHEGIQPILKPGIKIGVSDAIYIKPTLDNPEVIVDTEVTNG